MNVKPADANPDIFVRDLGVDGIDCIPILSRKRFRAFLEETPPHVHEGCVEVLLCRRGSLIAESEGHDYPFLPGRVFVSNPDEPHRIRVTQPGMITEGFLFEIPRTKRPILGLSAAESRWLVDRMCHFPMRLFPATDRVLVAFDRVFDALTKKRGDEGLARTMEVKNCVLELLLALVEAPHTPASPRGRGNARVRKIAERMRNAPEADFPVSALAREAGLPAAAFTAAFKLETGQPPHAYLLDQRIAAAVKDLEEGRLSIIEIAMKYRFASSQHFSTVFNRVVGISPGRYRQGVRNVPSWQDGGHKSYAQDHNLHRYRSRLFLT